MAADDGETPLSSFYWSAKKVAGDSAVTADGEFGGSTVWSGTVPGGLNHVRYRNWTHQYSAVTEADLVRKMRRMFRKTGFKSPIPSTAYDPAKARRVFYTTLVTLEQLEDLAKAQNDNLGNDLAPMHGETNFRGCPIRWVPYWDDTQSNDHPVVGIDWNSLFPIFLEGWYMQESKPFIVAGQSTVTAVTLKCVYNIGCRDRRSQGVISKGITD